MLLSKFNSFSYFVNCTIIGPNGCFLCLGSCIAFGCCLFLVSFNLEYYLSLLTLTFYFIYLFFIFCINLFILTGGYLFYNIALILPYIDMNQQWVYMCSPPWNPSHFPPHAIHLGHPNAPALSTLYHASNLDWWFISHMIIYMFQCHSPKSSHPLPLPQSPKDCLIHLYFFCCLTYSVIITIFLNLIYICISILYWCFSFWLTSLCIMGSSFIHLIRTDSNEFFLMAE